MNKREEFHQELMRCFWALNAAERYALEDDLTLNEVHLIECVFDSLTTASNNFSTIASKMGVTLGTLSTSFARLEKKGYLKKERYLVDQRVYYIKPTAKAKAVHDRHMKWHYDMLDESTTEAQYNQFIALFKNFTKTFTNALTKPKS